MKICCSIIGPTYLEVEKQLQRAAPHADLAELRIDLFDSIDFNLLQRINKSSPLPLIFTLRTSEQGGKYTKQGKERLDNLSRLAEIGPEYMDLEYDLPSSFLADFPKIISSYHDFSKTPFEFKEIVSMLRRRKAQYYKIATMANSSLDGLRILELLRNEKKDLIAIAMGEKGEFTRILSPLLGSPWTYASLDPESGTAPGQISLETLLNTYRFRSLNPSTKIYGLIGNPVNRSISHSTHNHFFKNFGINAVYIKFLLEDEGLEEFLKKGKNLGIKGLSVTMPFKESVLPLVDLASTYIDAVNTLSVEDENWKGSNTDGIGAINAIEQKIPLFEKKVVLLGAGGAAKAIAALAVQKGAEVILLNRNSQKAEIIANKIGAKWGGLDTISEHLDYDVLINTTPLSLPIEAKWLKKNAIVMDINTLPAYSQLMIEAQKKGCQLVFGYEMFGRQALHQFQKWFGISIDALEEQFLEVCKEESINLS